LGVILQTLNTYRKTPYAMVQYLLIFGSFVIAFLGILHLYYTFFSNKFSSRNKEMIEEMKTSSPNLTKETTMWKAWIGFNASHSSGVMFIGIINIYLVCCYFSVLQHDHFYFIFNIATMIFYGWLGKVYWFKIPFIGVLITLACYIAGYILSFYSIVIR
jgi:hypothetical protein